VRLVSVTWVQSLIRDPLKRRILHDISHCMNNLADIPSGGRLRSAYWNLMRLWSETAGR
jgi:predicted 2-oxoglutarate/Fe(II)-dependent dioxygenase YbiX